MMPELDGFGLVKALKEDIRTSHIGVILLTAKSDDKSRIEGFTSDADQYLYKPFYPAETHFHQTPKEYQRKHKVNFH